MSPLVLIRTDIFPDESEAIEKSEYYRPGKYFAEWLAARLFAKGIPVSTVDYEDWGWYIALKNDYSLITVCCSKVDEIPDQWLCFVDEASKLSAWFNRNKGIRGFEPVVVEAIASILGADPQIHLVGWVSHESRGWDSPQPHPYPQPGPQESSSKL